MPTQCVMIGDIRQSRHLRDWASVFGQLESALKEINQRFSDVIVDFRPTVGDEFQGALAHPANAYTIYSSLKRRLPVELYCGIGIGQIEKPLADDIGMRGTAFYRARAALEACKQEKRNLAVRSSDDAEMGDRTVNALLFFIQVLENSWTDRQREVVNFCRSHPNYTYERVGRHFDISKQAVGQILKAADWEAISAGEGVVSQLLGRMPLSWDTCQAE
jgi:hypothetical protein